jgi:hypothetical protein
MSRKSRLKPATRTRRFNFEEGFEVDPLRQAIGLALALGPQAFFASVTVGGFFYAVARGADIVWCAGFGAFALTQFFLWTWLGQSNRVGQRG